MTVSRRPSANRKCRCARVVTGSIRIFAGGEPVDPLAACPGDVDATITTAAITPLATYKSVPLLAYSDGGMHKSFRSMLRMYGPKKLAAKPGASRAGRA